MDGSTHIDTALRGYVDRIVHHHEDRDFINGEIRVVYAEAKDAGFNVTILRGMVKEQRMDADARQSLYQLQEEYRIKLGLFAGTPLGEATIRREAGELAADMRIDTPTPAVRPKPFAEQPLHEPTKRRGRPRKSPVEALDEARQHFGGSKPMFDA